MEDNKELKKDLQAAIRKNIRDELKADLEEAESEFSSPRKEAKTVSFKRRRILAVAASVALLIFAAVYLFSNDPISHDDLFAAHFTSFDNVVLPIDRSSKEGERSAAEKAFAAYEAEDYAGAFQAFELLPDSIGLQNDYRFYQAIAGLHSEKITPSIAVLKELSNTENFRFQSQAKWYYALALVKTGDIPRAEKILAEIRSQANHPYRQEAGDLLGEL